MIGGRVLQLHSTKGSEDGHRARCASCFQKKAPVDINSVTGSSAEKVAAWRDDARHQWRLKLL